MQRKSTERNKKLKINLTLDSGLFLFIIVFVLVTIISNFFKDRITYSEVVQGEIVESDRFNAMILCEDRIEKVADDGAIYFLTRSGEKVSTVTPVYCLDKTRNMQQIINESTDADILNSSKINELYSEILSFSETFENNTFSDVYQLKSSASAILINALSESILDSGSSDSLQIVRSSEPGYVFYYEDGYEGVTVDNFEPEMLNYDEYTYTSLNNEGNVSSSDSAYKLVTSEEWSILFKLKEYQQPKYKQDEYVQVKFLEDDQIIWGQVDIIERNDELYCAVSFTNSMVRYADSRFTEVEIIFSSEKGLKVPNSAIVVKELYTIPKDFVKLSYGSIIVYIHELDKEGNLNISSKEIEIYDETEEYYLISTDDIDKDTEIIQKVTGNTYTISDTVPISGVYNINRGYAKFNEVTILTSNDDFSIIQPNSQYGLVEFDHIVLNGDSVENEEIISKTSE